MLQIRLGVVQGDYAKVNSQSFLRHAARRYGNEYAKAMMMLVDMKRHERFPPELQQAIDEELLSLAQVASEMSCLSCVTNLPTGRRMRKLGCCRLKI